jgi:hypothetical protein
MVLRKCYECRARVSSAARACPGCGAPTVPGGAPLTAGEQDVSVNVLATAGRWDRPLTRALCAAIGIAVIVPVVLQAFGVELVTGARSWPGSRPEG